MKTRMRFLISLLLILPVIVLGQRTIGSVSKPASYSLLELSTSTIKGGMGMPQLISFERDSITTTDFISDVKAKGLTIFNESNNSIEYWNGKKWISLYEIKLSNGLNQNGENLELGGTLNKATTVAMEANNLDFSSKGGSFTVAGTGLSVNSAKQVGIGTVTPDQSAALDITATNKGFLLPRIALKGTTDSTTIPNPVIGLLVYNTAQVGQDEFKVFANDIYIYGMVSNGV
jgi:hypothetical protein